MTEAEWLGCNDPQPMLLYLRGRRCGRKRRLFAVACCRRIGSFGYMSKGPGRSAVEVAERYADGLATENQREAALRSLWAADADWWGACNDAACCLVWEASRYEPPPASEGLANWLATGDPGGSEEAELQAELERDAAADAAASVACIARAYVSCEPALAASPGGEAVMEARERAAQATLLRCIFGNPFRPPPAIDPAWLWWNDGCVAKIAQAIYDERRFSDLPILGDALEDAGCTNEDMLNHCRESTAHGRGCWVVDRLVGKE